MGILLDPTKRFIAIELFYIEDVKMHGNSLFHFIRSKDDFDEWKKKGYWTEGEEQPSPTPGSRPDIKQVRDPKKMISKLVTHWTKPNWKDQNTIISRSLKTITTTDGKTINELDGVRYRDLKLKMCLKNLVIYCLLV